MSTQTLSPKQEAFLVLMLRVVGTVTLSALIFVFVPYRWMNGLYGLLGWGALPSEPIVGYLARSTSAFYALLGVLKWLASLDVRRYRALVLAIGAFMVAFGVVFLFVDYLEGLGPIWAVVEAGANLFFGGLFFILGKRLPPS